MADKARFEPESLQVVSDLGQLRLFANPMKMRPLRILQRQEVTFDQLADMVGEVPDVVSRHVDELRARGLVNSVDRQVRNSQILSVYRATALIFGLRPEPMDDTMRSTSLTAATMAAMDSVASELVTSIETWPHQQMNYEGRRTRMPYARAEEFNEKLVQLVDEYWGSPDEPSKGEPDDPLLAFIGFWYRFPEES